MTFFKRQTRNISGTGIILLIVFSVFLPAAWAESTQGQPTPANIVAVLHCDYEPISFLDQNTNKPAGFFVDIMDAIARDSGLQVQYICRNGWPEMISAIENSEADLGALLKSEAREQKLLFSAPIDMTYLSFFTRSQSSAGPDQLPAAGYTVGVVKGSMSYEQLKNRPGLRLQAENSYEEGIFKLLAGEADLFAGEDTSILKVARGAGLEDHIKKVGKPFVERERGLAVQQNNVRLLELLNKSLTGFIGSPEYQRIYIKWYGAPAPFWTFYRILTAGGILLFIVICGMGFWRYQSITKINAALKQQIAERKQAEEKIQKSEEYIRNILNTVDDGFIVVDRDYVIMTANQAYCDQVSQTSDKVVGAHCYEISHQAERPCFEKGEDCAVQKAFSTGVAHATVHKHRSRDGEKLFVETKAFPQKDKSGNVVSVIETTRNITERHLLEAEQLKTQKLEAIGTLAGGIAHDFNNLLQGIFGYVSMAKITSNHPGKVLENLDQAEKALSLSVNLTTQLLTFAKGGNPVKKKVDLSPVIENAAKFALSGSRCECRLHLSPNLWPMEADAGQISQVVQNIVLNASEAMPEGGIVHLTSKNIPLSREGRQIRISIKDTGMGIPETYRTKIFDPYFTTKQKGSGLGLATSYSIVKNHGGSIDVESKQNKGTTFTITLPACEPAALEKKAVQPEFDVRKQNGRIILMDDDAMIRDLARIMVETLGHEIELACHGEEAIGKYQGALMSENPFDLVILDLTIKGGMGGQETIRQLQEIDPNVKAVVSSGYSDDPVVSEYHNYGFQGMLNKPYTIQELEKCLNKMLR